MIYYILAVLCFLFSVFDVSKEGRLLYANRLLSHICFFLFISLLIMLGSIRWKTGTDWRSYYDFFINNKSWDEYNDGQFELLYSLLNYLVRIFSDSYTSFLCIFSFLVIFLKYKVIKKIALYPAISLFLYYCMSIGDIFAVRQGLAISVCLLSIYFIHTKQKLPFFCIILIATLIHSTSIIWFAAYFFYHIRINNTKVIFLCILCLIIGLIGMPLYLFVIEMLLLPLNSSGRIITKIINYTLSGDDSVPFSLVNMIVSIFKRLLFIPMLLVVRRKLIAFNEYNNGLLNLYFIGNFIWLIFMTMQGSFLRLSSSFIFLEVIIFPNFLKTIKKRYLKYFCLFAFLCYGLFNLYKMIQYFPEAYIPYRSILK